MAKSINDIAIITSNDSTISLFSYPFCIFLRQVPLFLQMKAMCVCVCFKQKA